jgi:DNA-binding SARP family transcriptional activator
MMAVFNGFRQGPADDLYVQVSGKRRTVNQRANHRQVSINKISPPTLGKIVDRDHLFNRLDLSPPTNAVWLSGPGGSGKSTLIASYLAARQIGCLWYQLDSGDEDLSTFFYYLGLAATSMIDPKDPPLPFLTPEYVNGVETFAIRYFETLYQRLSPPFWIVFDNFHVLPADSILFSIVARAIEQVPEGLTLAAISRNGPPVGLSRLRANQVVACLGWEQLAFSLDECRQLVQVLDVVLAEKEIVELHQLTRGWIAGMILWLLRSDIDPASLKMPSDNAPETIFDYFGSEVLEKINTQTREFLLKTAFLAEVNADTANQLVDLKNAGEILETLSRNNYFLEKRSDRNPAYQYHPLFLTFLRSQAERQFPAEALKALRCRAAGIAVASGAVQHAVTLYTQALEWEKLVELIQSQAPSLFFQGRHRTLSTWLGHLPGGIIADNPWLLFWNGVGCLPYDPGKSRHYFTQAYEKFMSAADTIGQTLSFAAAVESYFILRSDMGGLDFWISRGETLETAVNDIADLNISGRFAAAMLGSLTIRAPSHPGIDHWIERCEAMMSQSNDFNLHMMLGNILVLIHCWHGNVDKAGIILQRLKPAFDNPTLSPLHRLLYDVMQCVHCLATGESDRCLRIVEDAQTISLTAGIHVFDALICSYGAYGSLADGDLASGRRFLRQMALTLKPHESVDIAHYHALCAWEAFASGDVSLARTHIQTARDIGETNGAPVATVLFGRLFQARVMLAAGETDRADDLLRPALGRSRAERCMLIEFQELLTRAQFGFVKGETQTANQFLKRAFQLSREKNILDANWWLRSQLAFFCQKALDADIETNQVLRFIKRHHLMPDAPRFAGPGWPWPLKIRTLGRLMIRCDDLPVQLSAKPPKKLLELLGLLLCHRYSGLTRDVAIDRLWPDADGDRAVQNLNTTLHRLRKLLGQDRAVPLEKGHLILNPSQCWVDAWYFEALLEQARSASAQANREKLMARALSIYRGPFDSVLKDSDRALDYARHLKKLWVHTVVSLGKRWRETGRIDQSTEMLREALAIDDSVEPIYHALMVALMAQGNTAEALFTFNRCRRVLARQGLAPAHATMTLYHRLKAARSASGRRRG